jgi:hypothetical protein
MVLASTNLCVILLLESGRQGDEGWGGSCIAIFPVSVQLDWGWGMGRLLYSYLSRVCGVGYALSVRYLFWSTDMVDCGTLHTPVL